MQKVVITQLKAICRRVNQYLLLQSLHDTRQCDPLLEPESNEDHNWKGDAGDSGNLPKAHSGSVLNMTPGMFRCPVVWEAPFYLHPRLKTGPGRSGLSRGIKALQGVLNRFSVNNRNNMFVYKENNENVFYLRIHEETNDGKKTLQNKLSESDEKLVVSRSSSIVSLSQVKGTSLHNELTPDAKLRPRVRSFGEKESDILNKSGDSIVLMVHGICEAGPEVRNELVQVLQNRLDDAVLEVLSVMLARNPMCKLNPSDVHFIQKPYRSPETIVRLSVQRHCLEHLDAMVYYLRQNILQIFHIPKYTDARSHYHFQDYSQPEGSNKQAAESNIFLYNQSHSSGSKGIACIAVQIVNGRGEPITANSNVSYRNEIKVLLKNSSFNEIVSTEVIDVKDLQNSDAAIIEFRVWKQGRVNLESLIQKLSAALKHATWDLVTEYTVLPTPLNKLNDIDSDVATDSGQLNDVYRNILPSWFQFALEIGVPAVKEHKVIIQRRHPLPIILKELDNLIRGNAPDTSTIAFVLKERQPFVLTVDDENFESLDKQGVSLDEDSHQKSYYVPWDISKEEHSTCIRHILVARNFHQWRASCSDTVEPELLVPKGKIKIVKF